MRATYGSHGNLAFLFFTGESIAAKDRVARLLKKTGQFFRIFDHTTSPEMKYESPYSTKDDHYFARANFITKHKTQDGYQYGLPVLELERSYPNNVIYYVRHPSDIAEIKAWLSAHNVNGYQFKTVYFEHYAMPIRISNIWDKVPRDMTIMMNAVIDPHDFLPKTIVPSINAWTQRAVPHHKPTELPPTHPIYAEFLEYLKQPQYAS